MAINPFRVGELQLPAPLRPVPIDFSPLQTVGEGIGRERLRQQIGALVASATDEQGNVDQDKALAALGKAGLLTPESLGTLGFRKQAADLAAAAQRETARHHGALEAAANAPTFGPVGEDLYGNKGYGFIDRRTGKVTPYTPAGAEPGAPQQQPTITLQSGEVVTVPPGMDPKVFRQHLTAAAADAAAGKLTETQSNAQTYGGRMENAENAITQFSATAAGPGGNMGRLTERLPGGEYIMSPEYQRFSRAKLDWITANLRKESGAAINADEFVKEDKKFFPQPGDDAQTIADKARARSIALEGMKRAAGPGYRTLGAPVRVSSPDEARRLPKGTPIMLPDGSVGRVP